MMCKFLKCTLELRECERYKNTDIIFFFLSDTGGSGESGINSCTGGLRSNPNFSLYFFCPGQRRNFMVITHSTTTYGSYGTKEWKNKRILRFCTYFGISMKCGKINHPWVSPGPTSITFLLLQQKQKNIKQTIFSNYNFCFVWMNWTEHEHYTQCFSWTWQLKFSIFPCPGIL